MPWPYHQPSPRPPWCWQSQPSLAGRSAAFIEGEVTLSRRLRTVGLLPPHASVGSWGQNLRSNLFDHLLRVRESDRSKCDIASQDREEVGRDHR